MFPSNFDLSPDAVVAELNQADKMRLFDFIAARAAQVYGLDAAILAESLRARESLGSTGFGGGIATPHARVDGVKRPVALFVRLSPPIDYAAVDNKPVDLIFALISPETSGVLHLQALAEISRMLRDEKFQSVLRGAVDADALFAALASEGDRDAA